MRAPFSPVRPGQPLQFSATEHNAFIRAAQRADRGLNPGGDKSRGLRTRLVNITFPFTAVEKGDVVRVVDEMRDTTAAAPINGGKFLLERLYEFAIPTADDLLSSVYAVAEDSMLAVNESAPCTISDPTVATVYINDLFDRYARPNGQTLESTSDPMAPFVIMGKPTLLYADLDMNVWQKGISTVIRKGVAKTEITAGSFGTVTIDYLGFSEQWLGVDHDVIAYLDWIHMGESISIGKRVFIAYFPEDDKWRVIGADCETTAAPAPPGHGDFVEASTTQTQAGATSLNYPVNRITICDNDGDSIKMPLAELGDHVVVQNDTDNTLWLWPNTDEKFAHQGGNSYFPIAARTTEEFWALRSDKWMPETPFDPAGRTFDGTDDYISLGSGSVPTDWTSADFTLYFECLVPCTTANQYIMNHGGGVTRFNIYIDASGKLHIGGQTQGVKPGDLAMQTAKYLIQHDTAESGFDRWKVWIDNVLQTNTTVGSHSDITASTNDFEIGRKPGGTDYSDMVLRDIRFFQGLLTVADIEADEDTNLALWWHFNDATGAGTCRDYSENGRDGTYNGTTRYEP